jgi:hypothetical protein
MQRTRASVLMAKKQLFDIYSEAVKLVGLVSFSTVPFPLNAGLFCPFKDVTGSAILLVLRNTVIGIKNLSVFFGLF